MYQECRHIKTSGTKCQAAALTGRAYCYFHFRAHQQRHRTVDHYAAFVAHKFEVPVLEDRATIQLAISEVVQALAQNYMDVKRGGKILYGLQLALNGMKNPQEIVAPQPVRELCQNEEGEDIAPETTAYEEDETGDDDETDEEETDEEEDPGEEEHDDEEGHRGQNDRSEKEGNGEEHLPPVRSGAVKLQETIRDFIRDLIRRNPQLCHP